MIVNWLITRKCNKRCSYCGIVHDPTNEYFKKISDINKNEKDFDTILESIEGMNKVYPKDTLFHIFYGGEPFIKPGFSKFIKAINEMNIMYTVITNGSLPDKVVETFELAGKYKGLTVSLDPMVMETTNTSFNEIKNNNALNILKMNQEKDLTDDMVIECVFDAKNIKYAKPFFDMMSKEYPEVSCSVSVYDYPKNDYYDFASNPTTDDDYMNSMRLKPLDPEVMDLFNMLHQKAKSGEYNIHLGKDKDFMTKVNSTVDSTYMCELAYQDDIGNMLKPVQFKTLTVDADGEFRLCLRIAGTNKKTAMDIFGGNKSASDIVFATHALYESLMMSYKTMCKGCAWTCPMMDEHWNELSDVAHNQG